jgi:uncharacterized Zn ribbon protein
MMGFKDTEVCPKCGDENAYFNGTNYYCPECGYEWDAIVGGVDIRKEIEKLRGGDSEDSTNIE